MSPDTDLPVLGKVAASPGSIPITSSSNSSPGRSSTAASGSAKSMCPQGYFSVATFQEPGWRTEGKKTLGLEMAEPAGDRLADRRWRLRT